MIRKVKIDGDILRNAETTKWIECPVLHGTREIMCNTNCAWFTITGDKNESWAVCQNGNENCTIGQMVYS